MNVHRRTLLQRVLVRAEDLLSVVFSAIRLAAERAGKALQGIGKALDDLVRSVASRIHR